MENKKIRIYIISDLKQEIINTLEETSKRFTNLEIIGSGGQNENSITEISLSKPDYAICSQISTQYFINLLQLSPQTKILILASDENRAKEIINEMEKEKYYGHTYLTLQDISPSDALKFISDNYEEVFGNDAISKFLDNKLEDNISLETNQNKLEKIEENNLSKIDLVNMKSKTIVVHSKKGGTGKSIIAKEIANLYSNIRLPKKININNDYLKVCLVDLDFEQGNIRTQIGIENPVPNIYVWIDDIIEKIEKGLQITHINYNKIQVLSRFVKKIDRDFFVLCTDQGNLPQRIINDIERLDKSGNLFKSIIDLIIISLKKAFDIIVIDTPSGLDEAVISCMEKADNNLLILNPTISDMENYKILIDELKHFDVLNLDTFSIIINKYFQKSGINKDLKEMINLVFYEAYSFEYNQKINKNMKIISEIFFDESIIQYENNFAFITEGGSSAFKKSIINICEYILPVFKIKASKLSRETRMKINKKVRKKSLSNKLNTKKEEKQPNLNLKGFLAKMNEYPNIPKLTNGFPVLANKPDYLKKKVWKQYIKLLNQIQKKINKENKRAKNTKK